MEAHTSRPTTASLPGRAAAGAWRRVLVDSLLVSGASIVGQGLGVVTSLALRMLLSPAQMGIWQGLKLLLSYGNYSNFGISKAAARSWSQALGRGETAAARHDLDVAFTGSLISSGLYGLLLAIAAVGVLWRGGPWSMAWAIGLLVVAGLAILQRWVTLQVTILRAEQEFTATSRLSVLEAVVTLVAAAGGTYLWGLPGLYVATLLVLLGSLVFLRMCGGPRLAWSWRPRRMMQLAAVGGPLLMAGAAWSLLRSIDKLMILACLGDREYQLGCYSAALLVGGQMFGLANMLSTVMVPRYAHSFGASGNAQNAAHLAGRYSELLAALLALAGGLSLAAAGPLLSLLLPDYRAGLSALWSVVPATLVLGLSLPVSQMLVAIGRERCVLKALVGSSLVAAVASFAALHWGGGLAALAAATGVGYLVHLVWLVAIGLWPHLERADRVRYLLVCCGALLTLSTAALPLAGLAHDVTHWQPVAARSAAVVVVWSLAVLAAWRWGGWSRAWRIVR